MNQKESGDAGNAVFVTSREAANFDFNIKHFLWAESEEFAASRTQQGKAGG